MQPAKPQLEEPKDSGEPNIEVTAKPWGSLIYCQPYNRRQGRQAAAETLLSWAKTSIPDAQTPRYGASGSSAAGSPLVNKSHSLCPLPCFLPEAEGYRDQIPVEKRGGQGKEGWALGLEASCHFSHQGTFSAKPSSEPALNEQPEPTVTFLYTLLNTPEPIDDDTPT